MNSRMSASSQESDCLDASGDHFTSTRALTCAVDAISRIERVVAHIPPETHLIVHSHPRCMESDRFRTLRVYLRAIGRAGKVKTLMVTSALPGEGKTVASLNLAAGLAELSGCRVVLVEADLRNPSLAVRLGLKPWSGIAQCLEEDSDPFASLKQISPLGIYLLPAGPTVTNPIQALNSERFTSVIQRLRSFADWVILDCPPVMSVPDAFAIRANVDGCIWVVKAHKTSRELVKEAIQQLGQDLVLGMVLNKSEKLKESYAQYYRDGTAGMLQTGISPQ